MRVPVLILFAFAVLLGLFCVLQEEGSTSFWTEIDAYALRSVESRQCFADQSMVCTFMACSGRVTRRLRLNQLPQAPCGIGVRYVRRNLIDPELAGVTAYPEAHHVNHGDECERWFYANGNGGEYQLIQEYVQRAVPTAGISLGVTYQRNVSRARFLVVYACATLHSEYYHAITTFNLRRLKWTLGENNTFIVLVEATPNSTETYPDADVIVHANFISPNSFYDAAAFQEGILEAFRLFGRNLVGFSALIILNDSIVGPWINLKAAFDTSETPTVIAIAVWQNVCVCGSGLIFNRAAFESQAFVEYWRFVRFPCGKWSAMLIYEGSMVQYLLRSTPEMRCLTFTNDIHSLSPVTAWRERGVPFYKHKKDQFVLDFVVSHAKVAPADNFQLETCIL